MVAYVLAFVVILIAALLAFGLAALLHLGGTAYLVFVSILLVLGIAAAVVILVLHHHARKRRALEGEAGGSDATAELDLLLNDANRKLRTSQLGAKTLDALPLLYILGETGSAKTTTVLRSGLDPELLAGNVPQQGEQVPTQTLNLWFTRLAALLEFGASVRQSNLLLSRLVHRTRARAYRAAFGSGAAPRAVIVCLGADQLLVPDGGQSLLASARSTNTQLREISRLLGMPVPVYVLVTKLDRVPHFEQYVRNLTDEEVRQALGSSLPGIQGSAGTYADEASRLISGAGEVLVYKLAEFRVEMLARETDPQNVGGVYEFPREFGKLRKNLNQYLVELTKPSQLSSNPYLRGFYFTGIRARTVERMAAPAQVEKAVSQDAGATQYINLSLGKSPAPSRAQAAPVMTSSRVPQWTFLSRLLPELILGDKGALSATKQSAPARLFRRILYGTLVFLFASYTAFLVVSYFENAALEHRIANDSRALPTASATSISLPGLNDLRALDDLRQLIVQLDGYHRSGAPWTYRFGLYEGDRLNAQARRVYFDRFRPMLLNPAQAGFLATMRGLPDTPATSSDFNSYLSAYNPLKAYLITTSNPEKSQARFLTPVFLQYWIGTRQVDPGPQQLAQKQIDFYADELLRQPPYSISSDAAAVGHTRAYLSTFLAETRVYQAMLTDADKASAPVDFDKQYRNPYVSDPHVVRGAFTKEGFAFMQEALKHPERYAQGETWVLGDQAGQSLDMSTIGKTLTLHYSVDFLNQWHTFLISARVASCGNIHEAPKLLNALAGPASPLLELFFTVSHNTAVDNQQIKSTFQPTQALVDPNATDRLIGPGNTPYVTALGQLAGALDLASQNPAIATDPTAFVGVSQAVESAGNAAQQTSQAFNVDQQTHTEATVLALLQSPIKCVANLAPKPGAAANGGGQKMCAAIAPLLGKFPFALNSPTPASLTEIDATFAPDAGAVWTNYNATLKPYFLQQGPRYLVNPAAPQPVNERFLEYLNRAAHISSVLYPNGQRPASFSFAARFLPGNGISSATLVVDGQRFAVGATSQEFKWTGADAQKASLEVDGREVLPYQGTWSLFQLVRTGTHITRTQTGYRVDYPIDNPLIVAGHRETGGGAKFASFELSGPGADLLAGDAFQGLSCGGPVVK